MRLERLDTKGADFRLEKQKHITTESEAKYSESIEFKMKAITDRSVLQEAKVSLRDCELDGDVTSSRSS
jgi:hypothetical protein